MADTTNNIDKAEILKNEDFTKTFRTGDVIRLTGPTVPPQYHQAFWRVEKVMKSYIALSRPYTDRECTQLWAHDWTKRGRVTRDGFKI
jgi:hypothetical protein